MVKILTARGNRNQLTATNKIEAWSELAHNKTGNNSNIPYKKYEQNKKVLTGPFKGTQLNEKELVEKHFSNIKQYATTIKNLR